MEIKSFLSRSAVQDLKEATGQFLLYELALRQSEEEADRILYLAVRAVTYDTVFQVGVGEDRYSSARNEEIEEELQACGANKERISQALKPFMSIAVHTHLTEDKYALLQKMQEQKIALDERCNALHGEHRALMLSGKSRALGRIYVADTIYPGVWLHIGGVTLQVEAPQ